MYSVIQSDKKSFHGDVVLVSFTMVYKDENSILDQKYKKKICRRIIIKFLNIRAIEENTVQNIKECCVSILVHFRIMF